MQKILFNSIKENYIGQASNCLEGNLTIPTYQLKNEHVSKGVKNKKNMPGHVFLKN